MNGFLPKSVSGLLVAVIIANSFLFAMLFQPQQAQAQAVVTDPVLTSVQSLSYGAQLVDHALNVAAETKDTAAQTKTGLFEIWDQFKSNHGIIADIVRSLFLILIHQILAKITNDIVAWINGGGKGKIRVLQDPGKFLRDAVDEAGGVLAGAILNVDPKSLCDASFLKIKLKLAFTGPYAIPAFDEKVGCTFTGMAEGLRKFKDDFIQGGWASFIQLTEKPNNHIGQTLIVAEEMKKIKADKNTEATAKLNIGQGFLSQEMCTVTRTAKAAYRTGDEGKNIEDIQKDIPNASGLSSDDFISWYRGSGGEVVCKAVTPAQNIKALSDRYLQQPLNYLQGGADSLTSQLGTSMPSILKPYLLAIGSAGLNLLLKKGQGLITTTLQKALKPRKANRQVTNSLQENTALASSAGALSGTMGGFRTFLLNALLEFSIFITASSQVVESSNRVLGRIPLNRGEWQKQYPGVAESPVQGCIFDLWKNSSNCNYVSYPAIDDATQINLLGGSYKVLAADGTTVLSPVKDTSSPPDGILDPTLTTTYPAGKMFYEQAQWCGAYYQKIDIDGASASAVIPSYVTDHPRYLTDQHATLTADCPVSQYSATIIGNCSGPDWVTYDLDGDGAPELAERITDAFDDLGAGSPNRFYREKTYVDGVTDITPGGAGTITETIISGYVQNTGNTSAIVAFKKLFELGPASLDVYPQGSIYLVSPAHTPDGSGKVPANSVTTPFWEKYFSPTFEGGSVILMNFAHTITYSFDFVNALGAPGADGTNDLLYTSSDNTDPDLMWLVPPFYPELLEKIQDLMEKVRVVNGYNYPPSGIKYYDSSLADQLGANPDDDLSDNNPANPLYNEIVDATTGTVTQEGYKGSVNDVITTYNNIAQTYQALFAGLQDENSLESVDKDFTILNPKEQNIRLALIGKRCPVIAPSATSNPDLIQQCPTLATGEYNMARKFIFQPDDLSEAATGLTTGFATNPFSGAKSSAIAGVLNLEDMTTQLQSLPPDKNIVKLIRLRQILEQVQVAPQRMQIPGKTK
ncbi:hypothetical protein HYR65_01125, partial [Candidatus Azambacteria bacterium]|nr:hypothetical protein [Candidatus Azambacteria bacterium]